MKLLKIIKTIALLALVLVTGGAVTAQVLAGDALADATKK